MKTTMKTFTGTQLFAGIVTLAVATAVIGGLMIAGSPQAERARQADAQRLSELQQISYALDNYWNTNQAFPASLDALAKSPDSYLQSIRDPETAQPYEFQTTGDRSYDLCAVFATVSGSGPDQRPTIPPTQTFWQHGIGRTCYSLNIHVNPSAPTTPKPVPTIQINE